MLYFPWPSHTRVSLNFNAPIDILNTCIDNIIIINTIVLCIGTIKKSGNYLYLNYKYSILLIVILIVQFITHHIKLKYRKIYMYS